MDRPLRGGGGVMGKGPAIKEKINFFGTIFKILLQKII